MILNRFNSLAAAAAAALFFFTTSSTILPAQDTGGSTDAVLEIGEERTTGSRNAKVVLVEFGDFQCPYCGELFSQAFPKIAENYISTGKVRYAYRHFPLPMHEHALEAAKAAQCAAQQGQFWPMHDMLFLHQNALAPGQLKKYAERVGLKMPAFEECMSGEEALQVVRKDMAAAKELGVSSTPTVFVGLAQPDGSVKILDKIAGARPYEEYQQLIEKALKATPAPEKPDAN